MQALCDDWTQGSPGVFAVLDGDKAYPEIPKGNMNDDIEEQGRVQGWCQEIHLFAQAAPRMCPICVLTPDQSREGIACLWPPTFVPIGTIRTATAARAFSAESGLPTRRPFVGCSTKRTSHPSNERSTRPGWRSRRLRAGDTR